MSILDEIQATQNAVYRLRDRCAQNPLAFDALYVAWNMLRATWYAMRNEPADAWSKIRICKTEMQAFLDDEHLMDD